MSKEQFERTRRLALRLAGIEVFDRHRELVHRRSQRLGIQDGKGLDVLLGAAEDGNPEAGRHLIGLVIANLTGFFRHPWHFKIVAEHALGAAHRCGEARITNLPVIATTAHATIEERQRCLAAGMNDHLAKPIDPGMLFETVGRSFKPAAAAGLSDRSAGFSPLQPAKAESHPHSPTLAVAAESERTEIRGPGPAEFIEAHRDALRALLPGNSWPQFEKLVQGYAFADAQAQLERARKHLPST